MSTLYEQVDALDTESCHQETESYLNSGQRIIQAFEDVNEDYLTVAATIGMN